MDRAAFLDQLKALLPPGIALSREPDAALMAILGVSAGELAEVDGRASALLEESDPRTTLALFDEWERAFGLPDDCTPNWTFSRASKATYFDGAGVLQEAANNEPRYVLDGLGQPTNQVIVEGEVENRVANPRAEGAGVGVFGAGGTFPPLWGSGGIFGGGECAFVGAEGGIECWDLRVSGNTGGGSYFWVQPIPWAGPRAPVTPGQKWTHSGYFRHVAGNAADYTSGSIGMIRIQLDWFDAGGSNTSSEYLNFAPLAGALRNGYQELTATAPAGAASLATSIAASVGPGVVDVTLRFGLPQVELGAHGTSRIRPPVGTPGVSTRAADLLTVASLAERRARLLQRIAGNTGQSRAFFIALAAALGYAITITEHTPYRFGMPFGLPLNGEEWAHAWTVNAPIPAARRLQFGDRFGLPFQTQEANALDCCFRALSPAHSTLIFNPV